MIFDNRKFYVYNHFFYPLPNVKFTLEFLSCYCISLFISSILISSNPTLVLYILPAVIFGAMKASFNS